MVKNNLTRQETQLLLYIKKLEKDINKIPYDVLYLKTSQLPEKQKNRFLKAINDMIQPMVLLHKWQKFFLANDDIVLFFSATQKDELEAIIFKINFFVPEENAYELTKVYNLKKQFKEFLECLNSKIGRKKENKNVQKKENVFEALPNNLDKEKNEDNQKNNH